MWRSARNRWYPIISGTGTTALLMFLAATAFLQANAIVARPSLDGEAVVGHDQGRVPNSAATVARAFTVAFPAETREVSLDTPCSHVAWPEIPANCLDGGRGYDVRFVTANPPSAREDMAARFAEGFE